MNRFAALLALILSLFVSGISATPASALTLTKYSVDTSPAYRAWAQYPGKLNNYVVDGLSTLTFDGAGDVLGFCVGLFQPVAVGIQSPTVPYYVVPLTQDGAGHALSSDVARKIGYLADLGAKSTDKKVQAAAGYAIWLHEYTALTFKFFVDPSIEALANDFVAQGNMSALVPNAAVSYSGLFQQFVLPRDQTIVPEPALWTMLITGFGLVGVMSRRRRMSVVAA